MIRTPDVDLARQLIRMPSTPESGGEPLVAELLAGRLESAGFTVQMDRYDDAHVNVVARWGDPGRPALCMSGHLDTVTVIEDQWSTDPHAADVVGSRLYGRGAVDMKTGVAAMIQAAEDFVAAPPPDAVPVALVLTAQEEVGSLGASALTRKAGLLPESQFPADRGADLEPARARSPRRAVGGSGVVRASVPRIDTSAR